jgi:hypothetical protein
MYQFAKILFPAMATLWINPLQGPFVCSHFPDKLPGTSSSGLFFLQENKTTNKNAIIEHKEKESSFISEGALCKYNYNPESLIFMFPTPYSVYNESLRCKQRGITSIEPTLSGVVFSFHTFTLQFII